MQESLMFFGTVLLSVYIIMLLGMFIFIYKIIKQSDSIYKSRDYYDKILEDYILESYGIIYSKHILPFIASNVTMDLAENDKFFVSTNKKFLEVLNLKLGNMKQDIYLKLFGSENNFCDYVLLRLSVLLQEDVVDGIIKRNIDLEQNSTNINISEKES